MLLVRVLYVWLARGLVREREDMKMEMKETRKEPLHCVGQLLFIKYKRGKEVVEAGVFDLQR
jgi:hypothetical protein